jgi:hypothetical protein
MSSLRLTVLLCAGDFIEDKNASCPLMPRSRAISARPLSLFDADPIFGRRSFKILLRNDAKAGLGDQLLLQTSNDNQFVTRGVEIIGDCPNVPAAVLDTLKVGGAICLEVIGVGAISNTLEVAPK